MTLRNRGKKSRDDKIFGPKWLPVFKEAVDDYCFLMSRGYAEHSVQEIVGNRYRLNSRQRNAIRRIGSSKQAIEARAQKVYQPQEIRGASVEIDGFNLLILLESALSGAYIFKGRDGTYRDISSVHGSYKRVVKTEEAVLLLGKALHVLQPKSVKWYFDQPVSNSGRMKTLLQEISAANNFAWEVELVFSPDKLLAKSEAVVVTSDGWILDEAKHWFNFGAYLIEHHLSGINVIAV